ncbi:hypothetical protein XA68_15770 [Ophiocordyceps unilateralis]|uniref:Ribonuclease n=1 Tax=Ophiocordyceps unilateralis TaxID=268505 RepID=A0A2A9P7W2_OPHUN|nr:hypothetical protein XA68_15770 [Ophiocordyceps unilateralis]
MDESAVAAATFVPPSIHADTLVSGSSYTHLSDIPPALLASPSLPPCVLGIDEAGRGPVLGPMVYAAFVLPSSLSTTLLREKYGFDDSKALTPALRTQLMRSLCTAGSDLHDVCAWAVSVLSARDISAAMMRPAGPHTLNAQAFDATVELIRRVCEAGVNVREIYVDAVGPPVPYQARLQRLFPTATVVVANKADSLYPCVSAASVCAKVTRDAALEHLFAARAPSSGSGLSWGSGYPSDARCVAWMRANLHPIFGWGPECRFSWGTAKDMLDGKAAAVKVDWPLPHDADSRRLTDYFLPNADERGSDELGSWFGTSVGLEAL